LQKVGINITCQKLRENVRTNQLFTDDTTPHVSGKVMLEVAFSSSMRITTILQMGVSCIVDPIAGKMGLVGDKIPKSMDWSWRCTELATTVTGSEPIRLSCMGFHESYGVCTQGVNERGNTPANSQRCKKHQQRCGSS